MSLYSGIAGRPLEAVTVYGTYEWHQVRRGTKPEDAVQAAEFRRYYLLRKGISSMAIKRNGLCNPFREHDAMMCLVNDLERG